MTRMEFSLRDPHTLAAMYPYGTGIFISVKLEGMLDLEGKHNGEPYESLPSESLERWKIGVKISDQGEFEGELLEFCQVCYREF